MPADDPQLARVDAYIEALFAPEDDVLRENLRTAERAGLPDIQVSPSQGKLLYLLAKIAGARRVLEIGTLGGYSTTWLARAIGPAGRIVTLELDPRHAAAARASVDRLANAPAIDIRVGPASDALRAMAAAGEAPFDLVFIDADKVRYREYLDLCLPLMRPGGLILADNVIRDGRVADVLPLDDNARGAHAFNAAAAAHPRLESIVVPVIRRYLDGLSISRVRD